MVAGPDGAVIAEAPSQMLVARIDAQTLRDARSAFEYTFRFRRPELYDLMTKPAGRARS